MHWQGWGDPHNPLSWSHLHCAAPKVHSDADGASTRSLFSTRRAALLLLRLLTTELVLETIREEHTKQLGAFDSSEPLMSRQSVTVSLVWSALRDCYCITSLCKGLHWVSDEAHDSSVLSPRYQEVGFRCAFMDEQHEQQRAVRAPVFIMSEVLLPASTDWGLCEHV